VSKLSSLKGLLLLLVAGGLIASAINFTASKGRQVKSSAAEAKPASSVRLSEPETTEAKKVASSFVGAFASYRYDEPFDAPISRATPFATDELIRSLRSDNSGVIALSEDRARSREVLTVNAESAQLLAYTGGVAEVLVVTSEHLSSPSKDETSAGTFRLRLKDLGSWKVIEVIL
jgi:hypothetical protein